MHFPLLLALSAGLTSSGHPVELIAYPSPRAGAPVVLLVGGLTGDAASADVVRREAARLRKRVQVYAIPTANPERVAMQFPPTGAAYREFTESHYLWRWIAAHAPDRVVIAGADAGLAAALAPGIPAQTLGPLPKKIEVSPAHAELNRRGARSPRQVAEDLAKIYGHELPQAVYIPAVAVIGRLRLGELADAERLAAPYLNGTVDSLAKPTGSHLAGHLLFAELAKRTGNPAYSALVNRAADIARPLHDQLSDAVFMGCPILAAAGRYGESLEHLRFMQSICLRADGIYRHSPLSEAAWGRGNAFPALGLAWALTYMPASAPEFAPLRDAFQRHIAALAPYQDADGMWHEVIDNPGAWPEFSATAMIATAMLRGVRQGWLDAREYQPRIDRAWSAINVRIADDGALLNVCESTGKQKSADDYLRRTAIWAPDPRGGAMALLFAAEMAGLQ